MWEHRVIKGGHSGIPNDENLIFCPPAISQRAGHQHAAVLHPLLLRRMGSPFGPAILTSHRSFA